MVGSTIRSRKLCDDAWGEIRYHFHRYMPFNIRPDRHQRGLVRIYWGKVTRASSSGWIFQHDAAIWRLALSTFARNTARSSLRDFHIP